MAKPESIQLVDYTIFTMDRLWDIARTLKRAQKRGTGLTDKETVRLTKIIFETQKTVRNVFRDDIPKYANTLNKRMEAIVPYIEKGDLESMADADGKLESLVTNMMVWMIDHIVEIEGE